MLSESPSPQSTAVPETTAPETAEARADEKAARKAARKIAKAEEKALLKRSKAYATENIARSWFEVIFAFVVLSSFLTAAVLLQPWWARALMSIGAGLTVVRGFIFVHDFYHKAILRGSKVAKVVMWWYAVLVLTPPKVWQQTHNYHHAHNSKIVGSHIGSYPILTVEMYEQATPGQRAMYRFLRHPFNILISYLTVFGFGMCVSPFLRRPKGNWDSAFTLVLHVSLVIGLGFGFGWDVSFFGLVLPLIVACAVGGYAFYAQHNFEGMHVQPRHTWSFSRAAIECSSFMDVNPLMAWFTGNIGYHHIHHLNPSIPFYRLPEAMAGMPEMQNPGRTSLMPSEIMKCFRCKLWDPEQQKMVGYP